MTSYTESEALKVAAGMARNPGAYMPALDLADKLERMATSGYILTLETEHFSFEAHGATEEQAIEAMGRALSAHGISYRLPDDWADPYLGEFKTREFQPGAGFRDDERISR